MPRKDRTKYNAYMRAYRAKNLEKLRAYDRKRDAKRRPTGSRNSHNIERNRGTDSE